MYRDGPGEPGFMPTKPDSPSSIPSRPNASRAAPSPAPLVSAVNSEDPPSVPPSTKGWKEGRCHDVVRGSSYHRAERLHPKRDQLRRGGPKPWSRQPSCTTDVSTHLQRARHPRPSASGGTASPRSAPMTRCKAGIRRRPASTWRATSSYPASSTATSTSWDMVCLSSGSTSRGSDLFGNACESSRRGRGVCHPAHGSRAGVGTTMPGSRVGSPHARTSIRSVPIGPRPSAAWMGTRCGPTLSRWRCRVSTAIRPIPREGGSTAIRKPVSPRGSWRSGRTAS